MKKIFRNKIFLVLLSIILLIAIVAGIFRYIELAPIYRGEFTPEAWEKHPNLRRNMIEDMEEKIDISNLTVYGVIKVLGVNETEIWEGNIAYRTTSGGYYLTYWIKFSDEGKVKRFGEGSSS